MQRKIGWFLGVLLATTSVVGAAETDWDSYVARGLAHTSASAAYRQAALSTPSRRMTMVLRAARMHWNELSAATQALAKPFMARPGTAGDLCSTCVFSVRTTEHFAIHYVATIGSAHRATSDYVAAVASVMEAVWSYEHGLGYAAVPSDGDALYDVYLLNLRPYNWYGYVDGEDVVTQPDRPNASTSYMVLDNDYLNYGYDSYDTPLKVTAAHEYFHSIQMGYDMGEDSAFMENSSTWMESQAYPTLHDNYQYLGEPYADNNPVNGYYNSGEAFSDRDRDSQRDEGSTDYPEAPLDAYQVSDESGDPLLLEYGRFLWPQYLSEKFGAGVMLEIWQRCGATAGDNAFAAMDAELGERASSLAAAYQEYATWGYDTGKFADGANYPRVWVDGVVNGRAVLSSTTSPSLGGPQSTMSTSYQRINNPNGPYHFTKTGAGTSALTILEVDSTCAITPVSVDVSTGSADWTPSGSPSFAVAVISNVSTTGTIEWTLSGGAVNAAAVPACAITPPRVSRGGGSGGALDWLAALALAAVYARRRLV